MDFTLLSPRSASNLPFESDLRSALDSESTYTVPQSTPVSYNKKSVLNNSKHFLNTPSTLVYNQSTFDLGKSLIIFILGFIISLIVLFIAFKLFESERQFSMFLIIVGILALFFTFYFSLLSKY